jgi:lysophospholipase L1-like esterase
LKSFLTLFVLLIICIGATGPALAADAPPSVPVNNNEIDDDDIKAPAPADELWHKVQLTNPSIKSGLATRYIGRIIEIAPGQLTVDGNTIDLPASKFDIPSPSYLAVNNETLRFIDESAKPIDTVVLSKCRATQLDMTILREILVPDSVALTTSAGVKLFPSIDFTVDNTFGAVTRNAKGAIKPGDKVTASYHCWRRRIDTIVVDPAAKKLSLIEGVPARSAPEPPVIPANLVALANVISDWGDKAILDGNVMAIESLSCPDDPAVAEHNHLAMAPVIKKLQSGQPVSIVFWGDSITLGYDARSAETAYPSVFAAELQKKYPGANITVHNAGVGGSSSYSRLMKVVPEVFDFKPDLIVIEFVNDFALPARVIGSDYEFVLDTAKEKNARVILVTPPQAAPKMARAATWESVADRPYIAILHELARKNEGVALADVFERWRHLPREGLRAQGLFVNALNHPNNKGHAIIAEELIRCFGPPDQVASH